MPNGFRSQSIPPTERLDEVARLLALGFLRLRAPGQALPEPLGGRPRDHRHPVVRAAVLRPAQDRERRMSRHGAKPKVRCAVYTRKSSEEGLELAFNSHDAQREACAAYIDSQRHEGWVALDDRYDDGRYSGGTMER